MSKESLSQYLDMVKRHIQEIEEFPMKYAFSEEQLQEALKQLGAKREECISFYGCIMKKSDIPKYKEMCAKQEAEIRKALKNEEFAKEAFRYEMDNHEYAINWEGDENVLSSLYIDWNFVEENHLENAYSEAKREHMIQMEEKGFI